MWRGNVTKTLLIASYRRYCLCRSAIKGTVLCCSCTCDRVAHWQRDHGCCACNTALCQQTSKAPVLSDSHGEDRSRSNRGCSGRQDTTCTEPEDAPCQRLSAHVAWLLLDGMLHGGTRQGAVACALYTACTADGLDALSCRPQVKIMHTAAGNALFESMLPALGCHYSCLIQA